MKRAAPYQVTQFERDILKSPRLIGRYADIKPYVRQFAQPGMHYTLTQVPNTMITCTGCQGTKMVYINHTNGLVTKEPCPICNKTGVMSNSKEPEGGS